MIIKTSENKNITRKICLVLAIFGTLLIGISGTASAIGQGFTVTSVSTSEVFTKNTDPSTVYWIINVQIDGGGQSITGTIDPSVIKNFMNGKVYTKKNFKIDINSVNEQVVYDIRNEGIGIYNYNKQFFNAPNSCFLGVCVQSGDPQLCPSDSIGGSLGIQVGKSTILKYTQRRYCVTKEQVATKGAYENPLINFNANIRLDLGDVVKEKTICSGSVQGCDGSSVNFDEVGTATWTGSLVTGEPAPNQNNFVTINRLDSNRWQIIPRSDWELYIPKLSYVDPQLKDSTTDNQINDLVNLINTETNNLLNEDASFTSSPFTKDSNTGRITVNLERKLTSQNIVFRIRADKVGIYIPSGQPKVLDIKTNKFRSGETGNIDVKVQNIGDAPGTFTAQLANCDTLIQTTSSQTSRKTLQPGDIDTIPLMISGGNISEDITRTCSIKIYDINDPSIETASNVTVQLEKPRICAPDQVFTDGNTIKRCNKDGTAVEIVENCQYGVEYNTKGNPICSKPSPSELIKSQICSITDRTHLLLEKWPSLVRMLNQFCN